MPARSRGRATLEIMVTVFLFPFWVVCGVEMSRPGNLEAQTGVQDIASGGDDDPTHRREQSLLSCWAVLAKREVMVGQSIWRH